ncbi:hypothetical protein BLNAU_24679 [Blattamonas nauphoetae]|uniref:Uncharacterized protein n=1 Tax=Blattamonas nauphoetae TaxID=2049346 RepID=A0ABQ9WLT0_9EUKA|nr:hypothetical protein BLNAU_24679 [Blattamonas nauphoetae]
MIRNTESFWVKTLEGLIARMNEGKQCSDLGFQGFMSFMDCQPKYLRMGYITPLPFSLDSMNLSVISATYQLFSTFGSCPSPLNSTNSTRLIDVIFSRVIRIRFYTKSMKDDQCRGELDEFYLSFHEQTKDYLIYLSLHPFALERCNQNVILDFSQIFGSDLENRLMMPYQKLDWGEAMNASDLSLSCSPFILTSDLVCHLPDEEIMNVVDRIVALLQSDAPIDDDTILRIHAFHKYQLKSVATRLNESQLERLITPSINIIGKSIFGQEQLEYYERDEQENVFIEISQLCDRRVIAQCLGKIGVFSHIVSGLLEDRTYSTYRRFLHALIYHIQSSGNERAEMKKLRRAIHLFMEEGWQDALDAVIILTKACGGRRHRITLNDEIMQFFGVNFRGGTQ